MLPFLGGSIWRDRPAGGALLGGCLVGLLAFGCPRLGSAQGAPAPSIIHLVVMKLEIRGYQSAYREIVEGTGFFIAASGIALTSSHVVSLARREPATYKVVAVVGGEFYGATLVCADSLPDDTGGRLVPSRDVAEIQLVAPDLSFEELSYRGVGFARAHHGPLPAFPALAFGAPPAVGDFVRVLGFGHQEAEVLPSEWSAPGTVRALGSAGDGTQLFGIKFERDAEPGHSGSPVLNRQGEVVGILTWTIASDRTLGIAISRAALDPVCR
ncbi:MAG TPA: serine protease [bacterium]|nr:serine protease [bacterium]